jgi:hypothetical protein
MIRTKRPYRLPVLWLFGLAAAVTLIGCAPVRQAWDEAHSAQPISLSTGVLAGQVLDALTGAGLAAGRVDLLGDDGQPITDQPATAWVQRGDFRFATARPGTYRLRVSADGYRTHLSEPVRVHAGQTFTTRVELQPLN